MAKSFAIEGPEGAGKTTLTFILDVVLRETTSFPILKIHEPGSAKASQMIRNALLRGEEFRDMDPITTMLLYTAARVETMQKVVSPFFAKHPNGISISDRCWTSTFVYQVVDGVNLDYVKAVQEPFMGYPDRIFYVDLPPEESLVRVAAAKRQGADVDWRDGVDLETYIRNRERYFKLLHEFGRRFSVIDGFGQIQDKVFAMRQEILTEVTKTNDEGVSETALQERDSFTQSDLLAYFYKLEKEGRLHLNEITANTESTRKELGARPREELRQEMLANWGAEGLRAIGVKGERG